MKIFNNFDTKLDERELRDAVEKYGMGNAILTKKNWIFLLAPLFLLVISIGIFVLLARFSYKQYYAFHPEIFWIICSAQVVITLVRIIHSIKTIVQTMIKHKDTPYFGSVSEESLKNGKFEHYLKHSFVSIILQAILMIVDVCLTISLKDNAISDRLFTTGGIIVNLLFIYIIWMTVYKLIDYEMRFNIFTPDLFTIYRQKSILNTDNRRIPTAEIAEIKEVQQGLGALLGYGQITISSKKGVDTDMVNITYVTKPKKLMKKLTEFMEKSKV